MDDRELRRVFTLASAFKEGDLAAGGTTDDRLRDEARRALLATTVGEIRRTPLVAELSSVARALFNPLDGSGVSIGSSRHFGSRIQPNSPGDDEQEILFSILEGLSFGCGDVIIGLNPAADEVETIVRLERLLSQVVERLELPTRFCVLSDIVKQHEARKHTRVDAA